MRVRRLDKGHDWTFGAGLRSYAINSEAIAQCVITALKSLRSDWFLDLGHGVRWFNYLAKNPDYQAMEQELKTTVLSVEGVIRLDEFDIEVDEERHCTIFVRYTDIFNQTNRVSTDAGY